MLTMLNPRLLLALVPLALSMKVRLEPIDHPASPPARLEGSEDSGRPSGGALLADGAEIFPWRNLKPQKSARRGRHRLPQKPRRGAGVLHWMRIPKTGSTSLKSMLSKAQMANPAACKAIEIHFHDWTAAELVGDDESFAVLREPVQRFFSIWGHLRHWLGASIRQLDSPAAWGNALLQDEGLRNSFMYHGTSKAAFHHRVSWQQYAYLNNQTAIACLPTMQRDVQRIMDRHAPGCRVEAEVYRNVNRAHKSFSPEVVDQVRLLVQKLYPEDVAAWEHHCVDRPAEQELRQVWDDRCVQGLAECSTLGPSNVSAWLMEEFDPEEEETTEEE